MSTSGSTEALLTAAQLGALTGVPPSTLRVWTARYGFPLAAKSPGGHHRYSEPDVEAVQAVKRLREDGLSMSAAVARVREVRASESSIFAGLRRRRPELKPLAVAKAALLALSQAIEDEHCARAGSGLLLGSFQHRSHYRASEARWRMLASTVSCAVALADFELLREPEDAPVQIPVPRNHQLEREWTLIVDSPEARACLSAWELPGARPVLDRDRRFEVIWSFEPAVVDDATAVARSVLTSIAPGVAARLPDARRSADVPSRQLSFAADLAARAFGYLAAQR